MTGYYVPDKTPVQLATTLLPFLCIPLHHHRDSSLSHHWPQQPRCCSFGTAAEVITGLNNIPPVSLPSIVLPRKQQRKSSPASTPLPLFLCIPSHRRSQQQWKSLLASTTLLSSIHLSSHHHRNSSRSHHWSQQPCRISFQTAAEVITGLHNITAVPLPSITSPQKQPPKQQWKSSPASTTSLSFLQNSSGRETTSQPSTTKTYACFELKDKQPCHPCSRLF